ncbi:MAG: Eco57I restriction-modification methylase domain-containing protein [Desulfovibrio sp.]|nr:Eco57I restriction-modification methylase domain-containing protein [Desulfovibrio sp.]
MKFNYIIGNPPYQEEDGGGSNGISAAPLYHKFIEQVKLLDPDCLCLIIPSRWFAGGKGLARFRETMKADKSIKQIVHYPKSWECFPEADIAGGVCHFVRLSSYRGLCRFITKKNGKIVQKNRDLAEFDAIVGDNDGIEILRKILSRSTEFLDKSVLPRNSFGFATSARGTKDYFQGACKLYSSSGISYISRKDITRNSSIADTYKIVIGTLNPDRGGVNNSRNGMTNVTTKIKILQPDEIPTETYIVVNFFYDSNKAINFASYLATRFARYLVSLTLSSMHIVRSNFKYVPALDFSKHYTDDELYAKYELSKEEIEIIESSIKPMNIP